MLAGSTWKKVERNAAVRYELCRTAMEDHQRVAAEAGVSHLIVQKGQLRLYLDKSGYLAGKHKTSNCIGHERQIDIAGHERQHRTGLLCGRQRSRATRTSRVVLREEDGGSRCETGADPQL